MSSILFFIAAAGVIAGAIGVVMLRNPFYCVLALVTHLVFLAALFLLLRAEFVAAVQVVVYAGAVMVLYVFVVAYVGGEGDRSEIGQLGERLGGAGPVGSGLRLGGAVLAGALLIELLIALLGTGLEATRGYGAGYAAGTSEAATFGTPAYIGQLLLTRFLLAFEMASFLLLIAAVGGVVLARRRGGLGEEDHRDVLTPLDLLRPRGTGTTAEGVGMAAGPARGHVNGTDQPHGADQPQDADQPLQSRVEAGSGLPSA